MSARKADDEYCVRNVCRVVELIFNPSFDVNDWLDTHDDAPAREELEPDYSSREEWLATPH